MMILMALAMTIAMKTNMNANNPVKVSMAILTASAVMFFTMSYQTGMTWFPLIFLMLFMGGIIMMFMMLSSVMPNEKSIKMKKSFIMNLLMMLIFITDNYFSTPNMLGLQSKSFLESGKSFFIMMTIILFYFLSSMSLISTQQSPMRSLSCCQ